MVTQHKKQQYTKIRQYVTDKLSDMITVTVGDDDDARQQKTDTQLTFPPSTHYVGILLCMCIRRIALEPLYVWCVSSRKL